ncbi:hypothetical protein PDIG_45990 [Penicillium digitatum PHI26]|uniref:Uncharacterized protein n=2 Tax=Penicillium digitatum TaxID=36651 RepID=K9FT25_PEND2|nr:hypothetical protein PDIP_17920 [Penicillium digitatum Pd1]EKV12274.1 hypothetical protein PDIG_45990 [Penicillium digitatum PHI26]EKV20288.1 hypothetical protein PDIP_17920 [Penicillium digitatum Pd1]
MLFEIGSVICAAISLGATPTSSGDSLELRSIHLSFENSVIRHLDCRIQTPPRNHESVKESISKLIAAMKGIHCSLLQMISVLWPMFIVGWETYDTNEREFSHNRIGDMQIHGMGKFTRARELWSKFWASTTSL